MSDTDTQLLEFTAQRDQLEFAWDVELSKNAEESKGGGVGRSSRYVDVLLRAMHIHDAIFSNGDLLSHGWIHVFSSKSLCCHFVRYMYRVAQLK